jgi:hypothetical protein
MNNPTSKLAVYLAEAMYFAALFGFVAWLVTSLSA